MAKWYRSFDLRHAREVIDGSPRAVGHMVYWDETPEGEEFWYHLSLRRTPVTSAIITRICEMAQEHNTWDKKGRPND